MGAEAPATAHKVPKVARMTARQEMDAIKEMPRLSRLILVMKFVGVGLIAIGLEGLVTKNLWLAVPFMTVGIVVSFLPIRVRIFVCARCGLKLDLGQAICPRCGAPNM